MRQLFIVLGYGVPKNILEDDNYTYYLRSVFNRVFDWCAAHDRWDPVILFSGGRTDMFKPYRRTDSGEMLRLFRTLTKRPAVKARVKSWSLQTEKRSLSTLDNLLFVKELRRAERDANEKVIIFGEQTRHARIRILAKKVFHAVEMIPIDFDQSANRYLESSFLKKRETEALKFDLWALENPNNLKEHRALFQKKFIFLRKAAPTKHVEAVKKWWEQELREAQQRSSRKVTARP